MERNENDSTKGLGLELNSRRIAEVTSDSYHRRDCVTHMDLLRRKPAMLAECLREMGIGDDGEGITTTE